MLYFEPERQEISKIPESMKLTENLSSASVLSSSRKLYWNPEHPPASILNRSIFPFASSAWSSFILCRAFKWSIICVSDINAKKHQ